MFLSVSSCFLQLLELCFLLVHSLAFLPLILFPAALRADEQHPADEGAPGEDVWVDGSKTGREKQKKRKHPENNSLTTVKWFDVVLSFQLSQILHFEVAFVSDSLLQWKSLEQTINPKSPVYCILISVMNYILVGKWISWMDDYICLNFITPFKCLLANVTQQEQSAACSKIGKQRDEK